MSNWEGIVTNPFNPNAQQFEQPVLSLGEIIRKAVDSGVMAARTATTGIITEVLGNQLVNVQPCLKARYVVDPNSPNNPNNNSGFLKQLPIIPNVIVQMPMGGGWSIKMPIKKGDSGLLIFSDRSLDNWFVNGGIVDPADTRHHNLNDAIFIPGLVPQSQQTKDETSDMVLANGASQLRIQADGKFQIKNQAQELIANLVNLVNTLSTASTVAGGPFIPTVVATLTQIVQNLQTLEGP